MQWPNFRRIGLETATKIETNSINANYDYFTFTGSLITHECCSLRYLINVKTKSFSLVCKPDVSLI